ncbi:MAG: hypothetical protein JNL87_01120 [Burkholderiaceae bacterium]|nr:hypothetical protein [Burkholderiaceae bacterium]
MKATKRPGRWKPGESGNPAGRKPGTGEVAKLRAGIAKEIPAILENLKTAALAGDIGAARLLLERVIAPLKASEVAAPVSLTGDTLTEQGKSVIAAVASGDLSPSQAASLLASLGTFAKLEEADDLKRRIEALEQRYGATPGSAQ